jgi:Porin subfamily
MNIVKGLLLGSAASFVAVAGAQAADLPVKAKPVEYVKVCSLYGAGFFYIPGTDTCIKIGGAVRVQAEFNGGAGGVPVGFGNGTEAGQGLQTRQNTNDVNQRTRIYFSVDARQQTEFGTLRTFFRFGVQQTTPSDPTTGAAFWDRAFIQFAGFTVGKTVSFFDGFSTGTYNYNNPRTMADTSPTGITLWGYTAQFGNGISATLSAEDPTGRGKSVTNANLAGSWALGALTTDAGLAGQSGTNNGFLYPDIVGALRVDQAWGSAQVMAALHDASGAYYGSTTSGAQQFGHPGNAYGYAVGGALVLNLPTFGATSNVNSQPNVDQFLVQGVYAKGAAAYTTNGIGPYQLYGNGQNVGLAWLSDGIFSSGSSVELTRTFSLYGAYQHIWTPNWRTSLYGGYLDVNYDSTAQAIACPAGGFGAVFAFGAAAGTGSGCNPNFHTWQVGTRTQWNPVSQLDVGVDVLYSKLDLADSGSVVSLAANGSRPAGVYTLSDQDVWTVMFRVQRNFWP